MAYRSRRGGNRRRSYVSRNNRSRSGYRRAGGSRRRVSTRAARGSGTVRLVIEHQQTPTVMRHPEAGFVQAAPPPAGPKF